MTFPFGFAARLGLWENEDETGVTAGEEEREEVVEDRSRTEAVDESRNLEGIFD